VVRTVNVRKFGGFITAFLLMSVPLRADHHKAAVVRAISPESGPPFTQVTVTGEHFGSRTGTVTFNGALGEVISWSSDSIVVKAPDGRHGSGPVRVSLSSDDGDGGDHHGDDDHGDDDHGDRHDIIFRFTPTIRSLDPSSAKPGHHVEVDGYNFGDHPGHITLNGIHVRTEHWRDHSIAFRVPENANTGPVVVHTEVGDSNPEVLTVEGTAAALAITASLTPAPNARGWNNTSVTVAFQCSGGTAPLACPASQTVTGETAGQVVSGTVTDASGATANTSVTVKIDLTRPQITAAASPAPNGAGWNNTAVKVAFTCSDSLSGIAVCPAPVTESASGLNEVVSGTALDVAGNSASAKVLLNVELAPPSIKAAISPVPNAAGWNKTAATVSFTCAPSLSPITGCPGPVTVSNEVVGESVPGSVSDTAGNSATATATVNLDTTPPVLSVASPADGSSIALSTPSIGVSGMANDSVSGLSAVTCNGVSATLADTNFTCLVPLTQGSNSIAVVATDVAGNTTSTTRTLTYDPAPLVTITAPANLSITNVATVTLNGTVNDPSALLTVNGIVMPNSGGAFSSPVPLVEGLNVLTVVATNAGGFSSSATVQITLDTTPPHITIDAPVNGTTTTADHVNVSGLANDVVVGTVNSQDVQVTVNGVPAAVANRSYSVSGVPLVLGPNIIQAIGRDRAGNSTTSSITVTRANPGQPPAPAIGGAVQTEWLSTVSGDGQSGVVGTVLPAPVVVSLINQASQPVPNQTIVFKVTGGNGLVSNNGSTSALSAAVTTDGNGQAQVSWTLGTRAGAGANRMEISSTLAVSPLTVAATGLAGSPAQIVVDSGNNQTGIVGQALPFPFVADVVDGGHNRVEGVPVTFTVTQGGGTLNGQATTVVNTDSNGRAIVVLTTGQQEGVNNNIVEANFAGNSGLAAAFSATAKAPGNPANTTISGVVLDNSNNPIQGVTIRLYQTNQGNANNLPVLIGTPVVTGPLGTFLIAPAPVGAFKLMADGSTVSGAQTYPPLEYDLVTVAGTDNTVGMPIYLPALDTVNKLCVDQTHGGTLTLPQYPGFSLTVAAGSATFPGGSQSGCVSVTPVNGDKVPMAPGFGQQPRFIVTIQPVGTIFNPPAPITLPNVDGLQPNEVTEMYSYDHDLGMFTAIGTGTVSSDGSKIISNPGVGVIKAGWHCGGNPNSTGSAGTCPRCQMCNGSSCVADPSQDGNPIPNNKCQICQNGSPAQIPIDPTQTQNQFTFGLPTPMLSAITDAINSIGHPLGLDLSTNLLQIQGTLSTQQCCDPANGLGSNTDGNITGNFGGFTLKGKIWPPGPIPDVDVEINIGTFSVEFKAKFLGGLFVNLGAQVTGQLGYRKSDCSDNSADKAGCFYGSLNTTFTPGFDVELTGSAELDFGNCDPIQNPTLSGCSVLSGSLSLVLGNFSWPINLSAVGYNVDNCSAGLTGGLLTAPKGSLTVSASASVGYSYAGYSGTFQRTWNVLSCDIFATSLPNCTVTPF
jgi:hypothetical protein